MQTVFSLFELFISAEWLFIRLIAQQTLIYIIRSIGFCMFSISFIPGSRLTYRWAKTISVTSEGSSIKAKNTNSISERDNSVYFIQLDDLVLKMHSYNTPTLLNLVAIWWTAAWRTHSAMVVVPDWYFILLWLLTVRCLNLSSLYPLILVHTWPNKLNQKEKTL